MVLCVHGGAVFRVSSGGGVKVEVSKNYIGARGKPGFKIFRTV